MGKYCEQWEDMQVSLKNWHAFKDNFVQAYRCYQIHNKETTVAHGYGASVNHAHETYAQVMTLDALQALANAKMKDKEAVANLTSINLTLSHSLTQSKEKLYQQKQRPVAAFDANLTPIATKAGENKNEILPQIFNSNEKYIFYPYWEIYSAIRHREQLNTGGLTI